MTLSLEGVCKVLHFLYEVLYMFCVLPSAALWTDSLRSHELWTVWLSQRYGVYFREMEGSSPLEREARVIYLLNHQGWADFFTHDVVADHQGNMLARWAVALAFPLTWLMTRRTNTVWFFNRNAARGREGADRFSAWLDSQFDREKNIRTGLLGYPEGTRSHCKASLKQPIRLKKGLLQYAYSRGIPVQVIYTDGQLQVLDERTNFAARPVGTVSSSSRLFERKEKGGPEVKFYREPPILPKDFSDFDGFFSEICHDFEHSRAHVLGHPVEETAKFQKRKREWEMECLEELKERERQTTIKDPSDTFLVDTHRNAVTIHRVTKVASMQTSASVSGMSDKGTSDPSFPLPSPALSLAEESSKRGRGSEETYYHEEDAAGNAVVVPPFGPHFDDDASMHPGEACAFGSDVCVSHLLPCATERRRKGSTSSHVSARDSSSKP